MKKDALQDEYNKNSQGGLGQGTSSNFSCPQCKSQKLINCYNFNYSLFSFSNLHVSHFQVRRHVLNFISIHLSIQRGCKICSLHLHGKFHQLHKFGQLRDLVNLPVSFLHVKPSLSHIQKAAADSCSEGV